MNLIKFSQNHRGPGSAGRKVSQYLRGEEAVGSWGELARVFREQFAQMTGCVLRDGEVHFKTSQRLAARHQRGQDKLDRLASIVGVYVCGCSLRKNATVRTSFLDEDPDRD